MKVLEGEETGLKSVASSVTGLSSRVREILTSMGFPASKQDIIDRAKENGAGDDITSMLAKLTD